MQEKEETRVGSEPRNLLQDVPLFSALRVSIKENLRSVVVLQGIQSD